MIWKMCYARTLVFAVGCMPMHASLMATAKSDAQVVLSVSDGDPQVKDDLFEGTERFAAKAKESNEVNLDPSMLALAGKKGGAAGDLAHRMEFVVVRSYEYEHEGDYNMADVQQYFKKLDAAGWKHMVRTRSAKESTDICVRTDGEGNNREMVIISAEPKELSFVHLKGNASLSDLGKLSALGNLSADSDEESNPKLKKR